MTTSGAGRLTRRIAIGFACMAIPALAGAGSASAAVDVTSFTDVPASGCTLREAITSTNMNGGGASGCLDAAVTWDEIELDAGTYTLAGAAGENSNVGGDLDISGSVRVYSLTPGETTVSGGNVDRIFHVLGGGSTLSLDSIRVIDGNVTGSGGAVLTVGGPVNIGAVSFEGNDATGDGGAISGPSQVTINNGAFIGNTADGNGGAIALTGDTFSPIERSYFTQNAAGATGGAFYMVTNAAINMRNSTIHGNTAASGGGGIQVESSAKDSYLTFTTVTGNTVTGAGTPAGVRVLGGGPNPFVEVFTTILAGNTSLAGLHNCGAEVQTPPNDGYSLEDGNTCALPTALTDHNQVNTDPKLAPLADNGGNTLTRALFVGSPAIDAIPDATCPDLEFDQREVVRPVPIGGSCDIGAFEGSVPAPPEPPVTTPITTPIAAPPPAATPPKKCKKGRKLKRGKCVRKKKKK